MKTLTTTTETLLTHEFTILKTQAFIYQSTNLNKTEKLIKILTLAKQSVYFRDCDSLVNFHSDNIFNNDLPRMSSGSYITALFDYEPLLNEMNLENSEEITQIWIKSSVAYCAF